MESHYRDRISKSDETSQDQYLKEEAYLKAQNKVKKIMGFYRHLMVYVLINIFLIVLFTVVNDAPFWRFDTFATAFFWGIGLGFHALGVFGPDLIFGKTWENRMIKKYMDKENNRWE